MIDDRVAAIIRIADDLEWSRGSLGEYSAEGDVLGLAWISYKVFPSTPSPQLSWAEERTGRGVVTYYSHNQYLTPEQAAALEEAAPVLTTKRSEHDAEARRLFQDAYAQRRAQ